MIVTVVSNNCKVFLKIFFKKNAMSNIIEKICHHLDITQRELSKRIETDESRLANIQRRDSSRFEASLLVALWRVSGLSGKAFMKLLEELYSDK